MARRYEQRFRLLVTTHVFHKLRSIDSTLAEFQTLLSGAEVIDDAAVSETEPKELLLLLHWMRPLHVVIIVDYGRAEERIVTVYEAGGRTDFAKGGDDRALRSLRERRPSSSTFP